MGRAFARECRRRWGAEEGVNSLEARVTGSWKSHSVGAGSLTQVLSMNSVHF